MPTRLEWNRLSETYSRYRGLFKPFFALLLLPPHQEIVYSVFCDSSQSSCPFLSFPHHYSNHSPSVSTNSISDRTFPFLEPEIQPTDESYLVEKIWRTDFEAWNCEMLGRFEEDDQVADRPIHLRRHCHRCRRLLPKASPRHLPSGSICLHACPFHLSVRVSLQARIGMYVCIYVCVPRLKYYLVNELWSRHRERQRAPRTFVTNYPDIKKEERSSPAMASAAQSQISTLLYL